VRLVQFFLMHYQSMLALGPATIDQETFITVSHMEKLLVAHWAPFVVEARIEPSTSRPVSPTLYQLSYTAHLQVHVVEVQVCHVCGLPFWILIKLKFNSLKQTGDWYSAYSAMSYWPRVHNRSAQSSRTNRCLKLGPSVIVQLWRWSLVIITSRSFLSVHRLDHKWERQQDD
jgi:hypothetical protein